MGAEGVCVHVEVCYGKSGYLYACEGGRLDFGNRLGESGLL